MWRGHTVGVLHGLSLLRGFGDDFDQSALERSHLHSVPQKETQQQPEMFSLVLIRDEQRLGRGKHLSQDEGRGGQEEGKRTERQRDTKREKGVDRRTEDRAGG